VDSLKVLDPERPIREAFFVGREGKALCFASFAAGSNQILEIASPQGF
jgi:hypothetical protein